MDRLSRPHGELGAEYSVVVVGSGYGGGIAASRLARCGRSVCVLERGREMHPGEYPERLRDAVGALQVRGFGRSVGSRTALFDFRFNDINVLVGCGLGGTSLINAGVTLEPEPRIFKDPCWPAQLRSDPGELDRYYKRVRKMLGSTRYPKNGPKLAKLESLALSAAALDEELERPRINVTFEAGRNAAGIEQDACILCGDCVTGCNHNAKNTVLMNYLPDACRHGARIFTQVEVRTVLPTQTGRWRVEYRTVEDGRRRFRAPSQFVIADVVVLAAGTLGTTEILLRSRDAGLSTSNMLGERFHANGDAYAVGYDAKDPVHAMGFGHRSAAVHPPVGPNIAGLIDLREQENLNDGLVIEEAAAPGALVSLLPAGFVAAATVFREGPTRALPVRLWRLMREMLDVRLGPYRGATDRTQLFMVMGAEDTHGRIELVSGQAEVVWPDVADRPVYEHERVVVRKAADTIGATFLPDPLLKNRISAITVHPLGGAVMADDPEHGVVTHKGQVFTGAPHGGVHDGLYVADGSVIPRSLAANPLLTISALAERTCELLIKDRAWRPAPPPTDPPSPPATTPGLRFTERVRGDLGNKPDRTPLELVLTIEFDDVEQLLRHPDTTGRVSGTAMAPGLAHERLTVTDGTFRLFVPDPDRTETVCMRYALTLVSEVLETYRLEGEKTMQHGGFWSAWRASTTLDLRVTGDDGCVRSGVARVRLRDLLRGLTTFQVLRVAGRGARARYVARYFGLFWKTLVSLYGGILAADQRFSPPEAPGPVVREPAGALRTVCWYDGSWHEGEPPDDSSARVRLTRYHQTGCDKGPVVLAPGFGMTSDYLTLATIETNLAEFLVKHGYDVWLFDYRACTELHSAEHDFTLDDVAREDWPVGIDKVREVLREESGAQSVQVVSHCIGAWTFLMAMLSGELQGVRSAVCSQASIAVKTSHWNMLKARFHVPAILKILRIRTVSPGSKKTWGHVLFDTFLFWVPVPRHERCGLALCRWINVIYGLTHTHTQLNDATHRMLHHQFGIANVKAFKQIAAIMKKRHIVDHKRKDTYRKALRDHPERLRIPIHFLAGTRNRIFWPAGTKQTLKLLKGINSPSLYTMRELPDYAHLDCFIGKRAALDVFPIILEHLEAHPLRQAPAADPAP
ncbi:MAG TPA: GMC family oxidoreductase N-terminal domain-containing protein [Acidimicrobiia bacterium]